MRLVGVIASGVLALGSLCACSGSAADDINGDAPPSTGPALAQETPAPAKTPKHKKKKAAPATTSKAAVAPTPEPTLPPGEEFDPEHYDPEGDRDPDAAKSPDPGGFPAG